MFTFYTQHINYVTLPFSALTLLIGRLKGIHTVTKMGYRLLVLTF